jgi:hypothetical protein
VITSLSASGNACADRPDQVLHQLAPLRSIRVTVGGDHPLGDPPSRLDFDMLFGGEQGGESVLLLVGE